ncbi:hypothetical protein pipiens_004088 [Culex pipiens pipiens]|uniref:Uncharacterized protein n=1 Tax=Culex pipiens pipiens TaxID=38569 RepID=A0ABD1CPK2_CULPP
MKLKLVTLSLTILCLTATLAAPAEHRRVKRQDMEQMKPWMEWGQKWGEVMVTTVIIPAGQEAVEIGQAGNGGGGGEEAGGASRAAQQLAGV